jgi:hypothetical protein
MNDDVLCYMTEPTFGCSQPVRVGDLLRVKQYKYSWRLEGKLFLVTGIIHMPRNDSGYEILPEELTGIIDGEIITVRIEDLEVMSDS